MARKKKIEKGLEAPNKLKILCTIVDRSKADFYLDILEGYEVNMQMLCYGKGTAPSDILQLLGMNDLEKAVIFSVVQESKIKDILYVYEEKYFKTRNGKGVAFTIPISSMIGVMIYHFLSNNVESIWGN